MKSSSRVRLRSPTTEYTILLPYFLSSTLGRLITRGEGIGPRVARARLEENFPDKSSSGKSCRNINDFQGVQVTRGRVCSYTALFSSRYRRSLTLSCPYHG